VFQDGSLKTISSTSKVSVWFNPNNTAVLSPTQSMTIGYNTPRGYLPMAFYSKSNWCWLAKQYWFQAFPFWQFHVLFNSLFKVLFIFPSRYLFAIGLSPIFSFRWYLPPILVCIPKQTDSWKTYHMVLVPWSKTGFSPSVMSCSKELVPKTRTENASLNYNSHRSEISNLSCSRFTRRY
jgi:hypothetical protein